MTKNNQFTAILKDQLCETSCDEYFEARSKVINFNKSILYAAAYKRGFDDAVKLLTTTKE